LQTKEDYTMQLQTPYGQKSGSQSLQPLINTLLLNASFIDNIGLMHGKMGISVYFFHLARSTRNKVYDEYAGELIDEIYEETTVNTPVNFENGLAGIGWGIEYLVQNGFIEADTDEVLEDFDDKIYKELIHNIPKETGLLTGILGFGAYFLKRLQNMATNREEISKLTIKQSIEYIIKELNKKAGDLDEIIKEPTWVKPSDFSKGKKLLVNDSFKKFSPGSSDEQKATTSESQNKIVSTFDLVWDYPLILWFLAELYEENIFSLEVEKIIQRIIGKLSQENNLPKLHSNRLLLALALTRLGKITNAHQITHEHSGNRALNQSGIESLIGNFLEKINRNTIDSELPPGDATIRHGTSGIAWIYNQLHRLEGGSHFKNEMEYWNNKLSLHKDKDSLLTRHFNEGDNIFGILEGLAGMMLLTKSLKKEALKQ